MNSEFELSEIYDAESDVSNTGFNRDLIMQYIAAEILFPDEIRHIVSKAG